MRKNSKKKTSGKSNKETYTCIEPPCIHVVVDDRSKRIAAFVEDSEGEIIWIRLDELLSACNRATSFKSRGYSEASGDEVDAMARKYLGAEPLEPYEEEM